MRDIFDDGLTEFATADNAVTALQAPYCPIPARVQPIPLWGYRWRDFSDAVDPEDFRAVQQTEYRIPGAGSYEVTLQEKTAWFETADELPIGTRTGLLELPSGVARLRVTSGNLDVGRFHTGRATLVVTGEKVSVEFLLPERAVELDQQEIPPALGGVTSNNITVSQATVRVVGVPARSREPSEWRICDWIAISSTVPSGPFPLAPGVSDIRVTGLDAGLFPQAQLRLFGTPTGPFIDTTGNNAAFDWNPVGCATHYNIVSVAAVRRFIVHQRGWI